MIHIFKIVVAIPVLAWLALCAGTIVETNDGLTSLAALFLMFPAVGILVVLADDC